YDWGTPEADGLVGWTAFFTHGGGISNWGFVDGHAKALRHQAVAGSGNRSMWRNEEVTDPVWIQNLVRQVNRIRELR
ncbi:MAG TPA: hypothetical protein VLH79_10465, partial [Chthonomonadales bacterium]|nr:hypothetical protein [Chthonomonadales bacterium]